MISALKDAKSKAPVAITAHELAQRDTHWMPFADFFDADLMSETTQYQEGLENYCIEKIGKRLFVQLMSSEGRK